MIWTAILVFAIGLVLGWALCFFYMLTVSAEKEVESLKAQIKAKQEIEEIKQDFVRRVRYVESSFNNILNNKN